jgi:AcrR family transcriptional regulator
MAKRTPVDAAKPRRLDREQRQRQLVDAYVGLIATNGYANTSLRDLAARANISLGTLLHHFEAKEELLVATLVSVAHGFLVRMRAAVAGSDDPAEQLRSLVRALFEPEADEGWRVWIAFWHEAAINSELGAAASAQTEQAEAVIAGVIEDGRRRGTLVVDDPGVVADEFAALIDGVALRLFGESGPWSRERAIALLDRFVARLQTA